MAETPMRFIRIDDEPQWWGDGYYGPLRDPHIESIEAHFYATGDGDD